MTKKKLGSQVDDLGTLRDKIHALKFQEEALTILVKGELAKRKRGQRTAKGEKYEADLSQSKGLVIEDMPRFKRAAGRRFLHCVKVNLAMARCELGKDRVTALGVMKKKPDMLNVYKREPGKAPRRAVSHKTGKGRRGKK